MMILSEDAARLAREHAAPFHLLYGRAPVVAYVDATGRVWCPAHRDYARGGAVAQAADNSAMDDARCDAAGCVPIAAVMLAARAAEHAAGCYGCRNALRANVDAFARPCPAHMTYPAEILAAIVDGREPPAPPWHAATPARGGRLLAELPNYNHADTYDDGPGVFARRIR